jgi:intergrase/recombinase
MSMSKQIHDESQRRKQVKFRAPESIVEEFDQWCDEQDMSRAEALRTQMRAVTAASEEYETPRQPPGDERLSTAYRRLCAVANQDGVIREHTATSILASVLGISKTETKPMALRPLNDRGYLIRQSNVFGETSYHIAGWQN